MRNRKLVSAVLSVAVILGIVGCEHNSDTRVKKNDIEITSQAAESLEETIQTGMSPEDAATAEVPEGTYMSDFDAVEYTSQTTQASSESTELSPTTKETDPVETTKAPATTEAPKATATPVPTEAPKPTESPVPTATPDPTATPTSIPTPTPEPTPFDIDKSAKENGYEIIDIDMGNGKTERIYGIYVDMSGLDDKVNDYRESIGLPRLPKDTNHISETKTRAAEISLDGHFSHHRPNGKGGSETNIVGGTNVDECYQDLYNSPGHRAAWEDPYAISIYSVGFRRMEYDYSEGKWMGAGRYTVQYMDYNL